MRRLLLVLALLGLPGVAAVPALASTVSSSQPNLHSSSSYAKKHPCPKGKVRNKKGKCVKAKPKPKPTAKPKPKPKPTATKTSSSSSSPTSTTVPATATATKPSPPAPPSFPTPVTIVPTVRPPFADISVRADIEAGFEAAFFACGLPAGVTTEFNPNPSVAEQDGSSPSFASARTDFKATEHGVAAGTYDIAFFADYRDSSGDPSSAGAFVEPAGAHMTVGNDGGVSLIATNNPVVVGANNCSALPPDFPPPPVPTAVPPDVHISAFVSDPHPTFGETETLTVHITDGGKPVPALFVRSNWYGPPPDGIRVCDATTDSEGTATCSLVNHSTFGWTVYIQITFTYRGTTYTTYVTYMT